jgi:hypothetical protein
MVRFLSIRAGEDGGFLGKEGACSGGWLGRLADAAASKLPCVAAGLDLRQVVFLIDAEGVHWHKTQLNDGSSSFLA